MTEMYDSRVRARYVAQDKLSRKDVDGYLKSLPDLSENAEWVDYEEQFANEGADEGTEGAEAAAGAESTAGSHSVDNWRRIRSQSWQANLGARDLAQSRVEFLI